MNIRYARENEKSSIKEIWNYCFNDGPKFMEYYFKNKYSRGNTVVVNDQDDIVSSLQLNQYKIRLNNKVYDTSYVVGVSTFPQVRGMGYMKNIMDFTLRELYNRGQLVSILMPIDYRLYRKYGYEHCYDQLEYEINIDDLKKFKIIGKIKKVDDSNVYNLIDIQESFLKDVNGNIARDEKYYRNLFEEIKSEEGHIYIHESEGYIIYFLQDDKMFVREIFYKNIDSLKSMLKFIYNHNTQCRKVIITAPINDKIRFVLDNPKTCKIRLKPFMMGRIINFKEYINTLIIDTKVNNSVNVLIKDDFIEENNGVFEIMIKNGLVSAKKVKSNHDISFDINIITQLAFSYINIEEACILNNINENNINDNIIKVFSAIFTKKDNYINEYV
ncbi:GNAT family N-acetyltransferase [Romboutsia maritimum]|uniref:GNAT family N-acetyltransferase n=1 Tax=Romboutsia maritimum TaxID=2020948 RepID=A0A371IU45_9FIRM|nr:GNAT family N-acetyltransferase [Romboutsia maritimum]RDY23989.1 GNAT family N-acetyltransferase [Romboutsia maritimum]